VPQQYATRLALIAILTVIGRGLLGDGDFAGTVKTAAVAAVAFFGVGLLVGEIARRLIEEHVQATAAGDGRPDAPPAGRPVEVAAQRTR
jgi:hypothetical protein